MLYSKGNFPIFCQKWSKKKKKFMLLARLSRLPPCSVVNTQPSGWHSYQVLSVLLPAVYHSLIIPALERKLTEDKAVQLYLISSDKVKTKLTCAQVFKMVHGGLILGTKFQKKVACNCQAEISAEVSQEVWTNLQLSVPFPVWKSWEELFHATDT